MADVEAMKRTRKPWLAIGLVSLVLGVATLGASMPLVMLEDTGWPWHASIGEQAGQGHAEIVPENGRTEEFTGTPAEAQAWLDRRQAALKEQHGIPTKIAIGRGLTRASYVLLALGGGVLLWRFAAFFIARVRPPKPA